MKWRSEKNETLIASLQAALGEVSGKFLRKVLDARCCKVNGQIERFGSRRISFGDWIELSPQWKLAGAPQRLTFDVLYEDQNIKIINKPSGWVSVSPKGLFLAHRLDKETTGALILAKNATARDQLFELFEKKQIQKTYLAIVDGVPKDGEKRSFLAKKGAFQGQTIWGSAPKGLFAATKWKVIAKGKREALLEIEPETGRTHQIRVHLAESGHPILLDRQYAKSFRSSAFAARIMLHARRLRFVFQGEEIDVKAPLFLDMRELLRNIQVEVGELGELFSEEKEQDRRDQSDRNKDQKEVEQPICFIHQSC